MSQVKLGDKNIPFIYQGNELLYPNPVKDGLVLWYDFKGMKNSDASKNIIKDLSGNGNNGRLQNFAYNNESGYNDGLNLDGVDDFVKIPVLSSSDNTMCLSDNVYVYSNSKVKTVNDSNEIVSVGENLILDTRDFNGKNVKSFGDSSLSFQRKSNNYDKVVSTGGTSVIKAIRYLNELQNYKDIPLALSFKLKTNSSVIIRLNGGSVADITIPSGYDNKVSIPFYFRTGSPQLQFRANNINENIDIEVKDIKVEKGDKDTFWVPNINDFKENLFFTKIKSLKIYNRALTDSEIQRNYKLEKERWGL